MIQNFLVNQCSFMKNSLIFSKYLWFHFHAICKPYINKNEKKLFVIIICSQFKTKQKIDSNFAFIRLYLDGEKTFTSIRLITHRRRTYFIKLWRQYQNISTFHSSFSIYHLYDYVHFFGENNIRKKWQWKRFI